MTTACNAARTARALTFPVPVLMYCALRAMYEAADRTATPEWTARVSCAHCGLGPLQAGVSFVFGSYGQVRHHKAMPPARCPRCGEHLGERTVRITALAPSGHASAPNAE